MNRLERRIKNYVSLDETNKYYGTYNFEIFKKEGTTKLLEYEPFEMMTFLDKIVDWFEKNRKGLADTDDIELLVTHPSTLYSLEDYTSAEIEKGMPSLKGRLTGEHGLKENFQIYFHNVFNIKCSVIYNSEIREVSFLIFRSDDIKRIHDTFFTSKIFTDRDSCGTA